MDNLTDYYAQRASEYEQVYARPDRVKGAALLKKRLPELFAGKRVLELACGTGYWTPAIASTAASVDGLDFNEEVLEIARTKKVWNVTWMKASAYEIPDFGRRHDALFAGCWWSHVPLERLDAFLRGAVAALSPGALLAFADNLYIEGSSTPIARRDAAGNCYQARRLKDGSVHEVLKNFPSEAELREKAAKDFHYEVLDSYWLMSFRT
jgi:demethylmenaquinone methyltransferase/2-methoxy-6-polyprenyl-1,4-benzoquinol methylase